jgi:phosphoribosyl 1,2-cyclic phosphodiesterase
LRLALLGSGSRGNAAYLETSRDGVVTRLLVDAGLSKEELDRRLSLVFPVASPTVDTLDAILVTHDHADHVGSAGRLGRPIYSTGGTRRVAELEAERVISDRAFRVGAFEVLPVLLPHDAEETVGYVLSDGATRVGILTDCGHVEERVAEAYAGCNLLVLEANHDLALLRTGRYPFSLKRRVSGPRGHLSNDDSARLLERIVRHGGEPTVVVAAHLSQANNRPELARAALDKVLSRRCQLLCAEQEQPSVLFDVESTGAGGIGCQPLLRREQLSLDFSPGRSPDDRPLQSS